MPDHLALRMRPKTISEVIDKNTLLAKAKSSVAWWKQIDYRP